ncbi:hypothetical protein V2S85_08230 [Novosphingobium resinovorum]|nr:hypothetical protein [Novosphingobium resinovorum]
MVDNADMKRRLTVRELEPVARDATRGVLEESVALVRFKGDRNLTLGTLIEDDLLIFQLYIAGEKPSDAVVLTSTSVSRITGEVLSVQVHV